MCYYIHHCTRILLLVFSFIVIISLAVATPFDDESDSHVVVIKFSRSMALISVIMMMVNGFGPRSANIWPGTCGDTIRCVRRSVSNITYELGGYSRHYYRMTDTTFWTLHHVLKPALEKIAKKQKSLSLHRRPQKKHRTTTKRTAPNGLIATSIRLSIALHYFAGGDPLDIALVHGVSHSEVFTSVWMIVDAVHNTPKFDIVFPKSHEEQRWLARAFQAVSKAGIDICVAATDGILIWIPKPTDHECDKMQCGPKKFFCGGRKKKFGLNMQGTCDVKGRFLDVSIYHPGSTSDYLAFVTSPLFHKLEQPGFLAPGLAIFGDGAYSANRYMVTPFKMAKSGSKDVFNFYQSQLRIRIECSFGMLVLHRWAILRKAMPYGISVRKTTALVYALCKLVLQGL
jgi:DDE superfamily endonuclease